MTLGNYRFESIESVQAQTRTTLRRSKESLSADDRAFLEALIAHHPEAAQRTADMTDLFVAGHPEHPDTPTLFVRHADGSTADISLKRCIRALRSAAAPQPQ